MSVIRSRWQSLHKDVFFCDCADKHHLVGLDFDDEDEEFRYLEVVAYYHPRGFLKRLKAMWDILWGIPLPTGDVLLSDETLSDLVRVLVRHYFSTLYGEELDAHINRLRLAVADYFNANHELIDLTIEQASGDLAQRCIELIDIFEEGHAPLNAGDKNC